MQKAELIVALDTQIPADALCLAKELQDIVPWLKVGLELFACAGPSIVEDLKKLGFKVFVDLKMYDIPNTVYGGVLSAIKIGANMVTIHAQGGERMAKAAIQAANDAAAKTSERALIFGVTVLTSMEQGELPLNDADVSVLALDLAQKAQSWGLDGVVSSGHETATIKKHCGKEFLCLTPGIRPELTTSTPKDDQRRIMTPAKAIAEGSDFLVIGRPITKAENPCLAAKEILLQMERTYA